ncbi:MAG: hypothetical protein MRY21_01570 [Simkaniaceae bacterium]|nr:hypothetical protein [Simkaniaceae bacterium]
MNKLLIDSLSLMKGARPRVKDTPRPWSQEREEQMVLSAERLSEQAYITPPSDLDQLFDGNERIKIFSYGSLLSRESALKTLKPDVMETYRPALGFGVMRLFNHAVLPIHSERWGPMKRGNERAMLNLNLTGNFADITNGILIDVTKEELIELMKREFTYELVSIPVLGWKAAISKSEMNLEIAYTFYVKDSDQDILPVRGYAAAAKEGAAEFGADFLNLWLDTTFLFDRKTNFRRWELIHVEDGFSAPKAPEIDL